MSVPSTSEPATMSSSTSQQDVVFCLAEEVRLRDRTGRCYATIAAHDFLSDSSWVSSNLAARFPQKKVRRMRVDVQTVESTRAIKTREHQIQIQVGDTFKSLKVYETPSLFPIYYSDYARSFLQKTFGSKIHLPTGETGLLLGLKHHLLSPNTLDSHQHANLKLYQSVISPWRELVCGSIPTNDHDEGAGNKIILDQNNDISND